MLRLNIHPFYFFFVLSSFILSLTHLPLSPLPLALSLLLLSLSFFSLSSPSLTLFYLSLLSPADHFFFLMCPSDTNLYSRDKIFSFFPFSFLSSRSVLAPKAATVGEIKNCPLNIFVLRRQGVVLNSEAESITYTSLPV